MYKNVIFDIGGVMVDFDPKDFPPWKKRSTG